MRRAQLVFAAALILLAVAVGAGQGTGTGLTAEAFKGIEIRSLGPNYTTGRVQDIAVDPNHPNVYYVASAAGGLWKSENRGNTFTPIFDQGGSYNLCCVVVDPKNSDILWLGTGENSNPRSAMVGAGLYKSTDGGKTWSAPMLAKSEHLAKIMIDPRNSNTVYVAAQGPLWSSGGDRGIYKTTDGGTTWKAVLNISADTGGNDIVIDPNNPDVLYASTWQRRRGVGQMIGGGPESAVYKSTNAGQTWTKLTKGLPEGDMGRISLGVDPKAKPTRIYALINARPQETGFYRSDDAGANFERMGAPLGKPSSAPADVQAAAAAGGHGRAAAAGRVVRRAARVRPAVLAAEVADAVAASRGVYGGGDPGYYYEIFVDPVRPDTIWSVNTNLEWSRDGGKTFNPVPNMNGVHVDFHVVWADPKDATAHPRRQRRRRVRVVGRGQDVAALLESADHAVLPRGRGQRAAVLQRLRRRAGQRIDVRAVAFDRARGDQDERVGDLGRRRRVLQSDRSGRSDDRVRVVAERRDHADGHSHGPVARHPAAAIAGWRRARRWRRRGRWRRGRRRRWAPRRPRRAIARTGTARTSSARTCTRGSTGAATTSIARTIAAITGRRISPDLTRNLDDRVIPIMGKVWDPATTVAYHNATTTLSTIVAIDESPLKEGLIYVGTDDGNLQTTEDDGKTWRKTTQFANVPDGYYITHVIASPIDSNVVFMSINNWQRGDFTPYVVRSDDRGKTFKSIAGDLPVGQDVWSVLQDWVNPDLLFAGTEFGLFFTVDGGTHWTQLKGMPVAQVRELKFQKRENDLVLATFGRGFYVLDDFSAFREMTRRRAAAGSAALSAAHDVSVRGADELAPRVGQHGVTESAVRRDADLLGRIERERQFRTDDCQRRRRAGRSSRRAGRRGRASRGVVAA